MALDSMQEIFDKIQAGRKPFWQVVRDTDVEERQVTAEASFEKMHATWRAMVESVDTSRADRRSVSGLHHANHRARLIVGDLVAHAVHRTQLAVEACGQLLRLMHGVVDRRFTRFIFVGVRLRNAQRDGANFVETRFQGAIQQTVEFIQLAQGHFHCAHRAIAFQNAFPVLIVVIRLGTQIRRVDVLFSNTALFEEREILRNAIVSLFFCRRGVFCRHVHFDRQGGDVRNRGNACCA